MSLRSGYSSVKRNPHALFWLCAGAHVFFWTAVQALTRPNVLTDVIEGYAWGHDWPLGTPKHPPLAAWILEILAIVTGRTQWIDILATQLSVLVGFWAVWRTARRMVDETGALLAALLLAGIAYYNVVIPEFNPNVLQLPFWALMGWSFHRAVKDNRLGDWVLLGLWAAGGMYAKYSSLLMLASLAALMLLHPEARKRFRGAGPWLTALTAWLVFLPHLLWLYGHSFRTFDYAESRFEVLPSGPLLAPVLLTLGQIAACLPAILVFAAAFGRASHAPRRDFRSFDGAFLWAVTFGPFALVFLMAIFTGTQVRNMWGTPFWNFLGLWAIFTFRPSFSPRALRRFAYLLGLVFVAGLALTAGTNVFYPYVTHKTAKIYFPGRALAEQITEEWHRRYHEPLRYVVGDVWVAGNVGYYSPDRPHVLILADPNDAPWQTNADVERAGEIVKRNGGVMLRCGGYCAHPDSIASLPYYGLLPPAEEQPTLTLPQQTGAPVPPSVVSWGLWPPPGK